MLVKQQIIILTKTIKICIKKIIKIVEKKLNVKNFLY